MIGLTSLTESGSTRNPMNTSDTSATPSPDGLGVGQSHAKVILLGEHAVVYGKPAIAFPVHTLRLDASAELSGDGWRVETPFHQGHVRPEAEPTDELERLLSVTALRNTLDFLGERPAGISVLVKGFIPPARGLGSSAAVAGAIAQAVAGAYGHTLTRQELFELIQSVERVAHGTPSGLDAYATTEPAPVWFEQGAAHPLQLSAWPRLLVADTGVTGRTSEAVSRVRERYERTQAVVEGLLDEAATLTHGAEHDLRVGDHEALGEKMNRNHVILRELGVSSRALDTLVESATRAGALGAKLTGGGMGGCMIALVDSETESQVRASVIAAGARDVWAVPDLEVQT